MAPGIPQSRLGSLLAAAALWLAGMLLAFHPVFHSGFARVPGDFGDARLANYLLEHTYRWLKREPLHRDLWGPPFFHPRRNVGAYSDIYLSAGPLYWCWRVLGVSPETSFQLCFLLLVTLNYWTAYLFASRCVRLPPLPASFAAFLFAFAAPRLLRMPHLQMHIHFYSVLCAYALCRLLKGASFTGQGRGGVTPPPHLPVTSPWVAVFFICFTAQFYGSFYLGWFLTIGLAVALAWALAVREYRRRLYEVARRHALSICLWGLLAGLALADLAGHYLAAARSAGYQSDDLVRWGIPYLTSWWSRGPNNWFNLTNGLVALGALENNPWPRGEHANGLGPITYGLVLAGAWQLRRKKLALVLLGVGLTLFVCMTSLAPGVSLWRYLYPHVPAGGAIRALCRVSLFLLLPMALCAAWAIRGLAKRRPGLAVPLVLLCVLEQARDVPAFDKGEHRRRVALLAAHVPSDCEAFLVVPRRPFATDEEYYHAQTDAMWAQLAARVPTVNGYSGKVPPGWDFAGAFRLGPTDSERCEALLRRWFSPRRPSLELRPLPGDEAQLFLVHP